MQHRYQIIQPDWTVTVNAGFEVLRDFAVVVEDNRIQMLIANDAVSELPCYSQAEIIRLPGCVLMPGLVNGMTTCQSVCQPLAPASAAASISDLSIRIIVLKMGTTMKSV